jgi:hypothetical protein
MRGALAQTVTAFTHVIVITRATSDSFHNNLSRAAEQYLRARGAHPDSDPDDVEK